MSWTDLFAFLLILATAAAIPGPDIAAIIGTSLSGGFTRALGLIAGIIAGHMVWIIAAATGLAAIAQALGAAFIAVKLCAIAYLLYIAWQLWTAPVGEGAGDEGAAIQPGRPGVLTGIMISLSNPKALVFFSAVMPTILAVEKLSAADLGLLLACSAVVFVIVFGSWAALAAKARTMLASAARRRGLNRVSAVIMAGTGIAVATR